MNAFLLKGTVLYRRRVRCKDSDVPLRILVLQSSLPRHVRFAIFDELKHNSCDKYEEWVRRAIKLPLGVLAPQRSQPLGEALANTMRSMDQSITGHDDAKVEILKLVCQV